MLNRSIAVKSEEKKKPKERRPYLDLAITTMSDMVEILRICPGKKKPLTYIIQPFRKISEHGIMNMPMSMVSVVEFYQDAYKRHWEETLIWAFRDDGEPPKLT